MKIFAGLQKVGASLMIPIAVMPAAALLLGAGYAIDPNGWGGNSLLAQFLVTSGDTIIGMLGLLFAVGISYGLTKDKNGAAALSGVLGYQLLIKLLDPGFVARFVGTANAEGVKVLSQVDTIAFQRAPGAFVGIIVGLIVAFIYNKFHKVQLHKSLSFFSGRRCVPIITSVAMIILSFVLMFIWPVVFGGLVGFGKWFQSLGAVGAAMYGFFNRLLIPVGLHHALNQVFWFDLAGINDLGRFWAQGTMDGIHKVNAAGDIIATVGETGRYMGGFFPIMMFGLVGAAAAFIKTAKPANRDKVVGLMGAAAVTTFVTGVTEPIEFAFMFAAPALYVVHAGLTAISLFIAATFKWTAGFGFSAGAIDFFLSSRLPIANKPYMLLALGVVFAIIYYVVFTVAITKFNLKTPGREEVQEEEAEIVGGSVTDAALTEKVLIALGGIHNLVNIDSCITRLRLQVNDQAVIDEKTLKALGAKGIIKPGKDSVQVIFGAKAEVIADELRKMK